MKISQMKRERDAIIGRINELDDDRGALKDQLNKQAADMLEELESYTKEQEEKANSELPKPQSCEVCGTCYTDEAAYKRHLDYKVHNGYVRILAKIEEPKEKKAE